MKRFRDTEMWNEDWFISLPNEYKFFWHYLLDTCNHAGIWKPSIKKFEFCTEWKIDLEEFLIAINSEKERIIKLDNGKYWIIDFIAFQQGRKLHIKNNAHKGTIRELAANGIHFKDVRGLLGVFLEGISEDDEKLISNIVDPKLTPSCPQIDSQGKGKSISNGKSESDSKSNSNGLEDNLLIKDNELSMSVFGIPFNELKPDQQTVIIERNS